MTVADNKATITAFVAALNAGFAGDEGWVRMLSPGVIDHNKIIFGEADEPGAAIDGFRQQLAAFEPTGPGRDCFVLEELIGENDRVVARLRVVDQHNGSHVRMPAPTGRSCDIEQIWIFTLAGGYITEIRAVGDRLGMFLQLGWDWPTAG